MYSVSQIATDVFYIQASMKHTSCMMREHHFTFISQYVHSSLKNFNKNVLHLMFFMLLIPPFHICDPSSTWHLALSQEGRVSDRFSRVDHNVLTVYALDMPTYSTSLQVRLSRAANEIAKCFMTHGMCAKPCRIFIVFVGRKIIIFINLMQNCHQCAQWRVNQYQRREPYSSSNNSMPFSPILESPLLNVKSFFSSAT